MKGLLLTLTLLGCMAVCSHAQCSMGTSDTWTDQPYQTDPDSLNDPNGTPVGFDTITFPGTDEVNPRAPCVQVTFPDAATASPTISRYLYVLVATSGETVCVAVENGEDARTCGTGDFSHCVTNVDFSLRVEFSCDASCAQNSFPFRYRVVTEYRTVDDEDFCDNINATYPSSLRVLPTQPTVDPNPDDKPTGGSVILSSFYLGSILLMTLLAMLFMH